jgi:hypothetical protein
MTIAGQTFTVNQAAATSTNSTSGQLMWLQTNLPPYVATVNGVATDQSGNVIAVGDFYNSVDFGNGLITAGGDYDIFIAKYTPQGALSWVKPLGGTGYDSAYGVAIDSQGNIIVAGTFQGSVDLGGGLLTANGGTFNQDAFVAKYSPSGAYIWAKSWGSPAGDMAMAVAVDASDNIVATSPSGGIVNFGNGISLTGHGGTDVALVKFQGVTGATAAGTTLWAQLYGGPNNDSANGLAVDRNGDVLVTGSLGASGNLGGTPLPGGQSSGIFVAKYSGLNGTYKWSRVLGGTAGNGIAADPITGNVLVTGGFTGSVDFGSGTAITTPWGGNGGWFVAAYDPSGNYQWAKAYGTSGDEGYAITADGSGNLALTGTALGLIDFTGSGITMPGTGFLLANFTTSGSFRWAKRSNNSQSRGEGLSFDPLGRVVAGGYFYSTTDFGGISATAGSGDYNAFIAPYSK